MRLVVAAVLCACVGPNQNLYPAGTDKDDGHGTLAQASSRYIRHDRDRDDDELFQPPRRRRRDGVGRDDDDFGYGGGTYGGNAYGGAGYAGFVVPQWQYQPASRIPRYNQVHGLAGAIEGVISWKGALPAKRATACGPLDLARVGVDRGIADVLVYIERVQVGRTLPVEGKPIGVGGLVVKRGCALVPTVQIVTPLPAAFTIHGDAKRAKLALTAGSSTRTIDLQEGGRAALQLTAGVTRIAAADGSLASAWVVALETPYYAITDDHGRFRIDELAPGNYEVTIWRAPLPNDGTGALEYGAPIVVKRTVRVVATKPARLDVAFDRR